MMRASINTATLGFQAPIREVIDEVARAGFAGLAPWRREVEGADVRAIAKHIRDAGLTVTGYCRSTYIPAASRAQFLNHVEDNRRAIRDAGILGAACFVMVVGGLPEGSRDLEAARAQVAEATGLLMETAREAGTTIALEPLHPFYAADRSCLNTLKQALDMAEAIEPEARLLGICADVYHIWWDPERTAQIARAGSANRLFAFHLCDWLRETRDPLNDRGMMGDGVIDLGRISGEISAAGFTGLPEVEIFSSLDWWKRPMAETLAICKQRLAPLV